MFTSSNTIIKIATFVSNCVNLISIPTLSVSIPPITSSSATASPTAETELFVYYILDKKIERTKIILWYVIITSRQVSFRVRRFRNTISFFSRDNNDNTKTKLYAVKCEFFSSNYQDIQCHKRKTRFEELFMTTPFFTLVI